MSKFLRQIKKLLVPGADPSVLYITCITNEGADMILPRRIINLLGISFLHRFLYKKSAFAWSLVGL